MIQATTPHATATNSMTIVTGFVVLLWWGEKKEERLSPQLRIGTHEPTFSLRARKTTHNQETP
jgi:hypothetical protein